MPVTVARAPPRLCPVHKILVTLKALIIAWALYNRFLSMAT